MNSRFVLLLGLAALGLSACQNATTDEIMFTAFTGEAPGDRPAYIDLLGEHPLGRPPPEPGSTVYRPPLVPEADATTESVADLKALFAQLRLQLSDRDDALQFRRRSLRVSLGAYSAAVDGLRVEHGDPLPAYTETLQTRISDARTALSEIRADLLHLTNILDAARTDEQAVDAVAARAEATLDELPADAPDRELAETLRARLDDARATVRSLQADLADEIAMFVVYLEGQRQAFNDFERQVKAAAEAPGEGSTVWEPAILRRRSIIDP